MRRLLALLVLVPMLAGAQPATSSLTGRVTSEGRPVAGVVVTVASPALLGVRSTVSNATGAWFLRGLPPGLYDVEFSRKGMQTVLRRARLHVAELTRIDTAMAESEVEETVTSTTILPPLLETPQLSTPIESTTVDRLPLGRSIEERQLLAPGLDHRGRLKLVDGMALDETVEEAILESNVVTGFLSAEYGSEQGGMVATVTRSGGNELAGSLRATTFEAERSLIEGSLGGAAIEDRLWYFAAVGDGDDTRSLLKVTGDVLENHTLTLACHEELSGRYDGFISPRANIEAVADADRWSLKGHAFIAEHSIVAGIDDEAPFINDVWLATSRWSVNLGLRSDDEIQPRLGAVYDFRGDGEHRVSASWGRYSGTDESTASYGWRFGTGGYARAEYIRRESAVVVDVLQVHGSYDLFRTFRFGGNYTASIRGPNPVRRRGNGWFGFEPAVGDGTMTLAILQRYLASETETFFSTDFSAMYAWPVRSVTTFAKVDLINSLDRPVFSSEELAVPRTWRASVGMRF